ncbi:MAG: hypothetical protein M3N51_05285 [Actinomycetota bacterium]|nr:hypothetical protein [Actinomycetota bacterium]
MGQLIRVEAVPIGPLNEVAIFDTDRSLTGQDGHAFGSEDEAIVGDSFPAALAIRLFESDPSIASVYVLSNGVVVRRSQAWDEASLGEAAEVIRTFFVFYQQRSQGQDSLPGPPSSGGERS